MELSRFSAYYFSCSSASGGSFGTNGNKTWYHSDKIKKYNIGKEHKLDTNLMGIKPKLQVDIELWYQFYGIKSKLLAHICFSIVKQLEIQTKINKLQR